jgi:hypothetical protein
MEKRIMVEISEEYNVPKLNSDSKDTDISFDRNVNNSAHLRKAQTPKQNHH